MSALRPGASRGAGLTWQGRAHSGLDDARNTGALLTRMVKDGCVLRANGWFKTQLGPPGSQPGQPAAGKAAGMGGGGAGPEAADGARAGSAPAPLRQGVLTLTPAKRPARDAAAACSSPGAGPAPSLGVSRAEAPAVFDPAGRWLGLCRCGVAAHLRTTKKPGANHGRGFYSCGRWTISDRSKQCGFFV